MIEKAYETVLVLLTASTETIQERMEKSPHKKSVLKKEGIVQSS